MRRFELALATSQRLMVHGLRNPVSDGLSGETCSGPTCLPHEPLFTSHCTPLRLSILRSRSMGLVLATGQGTSQQTGLE